MMICLDVELVEINALYSFDNVLYIDFIVMTGESLSCPSILATTGRPTPLIYFGHRGRIIGVVKYFHF